MIKAEKALPLYLAVGVLCLAAWGCDRAQPAKDHGSQKRAGVTNQVTPEMTPNGLRKAAESGDARAQYRLGQCYFWGQGLPKDNTEALKWYRKAAEQGNADAQSQLGALIGNGCGIAQDYGEAIKWFRKAAQQGNASAEDSLGQCYFYGRGLPIDYTEAVKWFRKAAEQGMAGAQANLGYSFLRGKGVPQDYAQAIKCFRSAAEQGNDFAQNHLGNCYRDGQGVAQDYAEAIKWFREAAEQGSAYAQYSLGALFWKGEGVSRDYTAAVKWLRRAAEQGDAAGQYSLGACCANGEGVPQNDIEAYKWFCLSAAQRDGLGAEERDRIAKRMARQEVAEGQRRASAFVSKQEGVDWDNFQPLDPPFPGSGSGFFVSDDGYVVTCEHVVRGGTSLHVKSSDRFLSAKLIKKSRKLDVALLKITGVFHALPVPPDPLVKLGDSVFTIGFPNPDVQGVQPKLTRGEISSLAGMQDNLNYYQISVPVQPGNSGGPLVSEYGNVVGVVTARLNDAFAYETSGALPQNVNYAIKGNLVRDFLDAVPELVGKLKAPHAAKDREAGSAAERATVLVIAE